jgi:hypothetical protein
MLNSKTLVKSHEPALLVMLIMLLLTIHECHPSMLHVFFVATMLLYNTIQ